MTQDTRKPAGGAASAALAQLMIGNGVDATTGEYLLPPIEIRELARLATGVRLDGAELTDVRGKTIQKVALSATVVEGVDPNDLTQTGWAVVFPAADTGSEAAARQAAIREALAPLLALRRAAAGALYREYAGELGYLPGETKQQYLARLGAGPGPARPEKVPYYLLLIATPEEIPFRIQYQLDVHYAVGRIAFDTVEEYARYAHGVVDAETGRAGRPRRAAFFGVANPNDAATRLSADHLVLPLVEYTGGRRAEHGFAVDSHLGDAATRGKLTELLGDAPALLFTASHGMGFPCGDPGQRDRQGAILCQDWGGPGTPVAREHYFAGEDVPAGADLRGMIGVLFACYGGGTPTRDEFTRRALGEAQARQLAPAALLARLPQRLLAHPGGGALAVIAHVDRAWGSAFLWIDAQGKGTTQRHLDVFESLLDSLLGGKRLGCAMEAFNLRYAELAADLAERIEQIQLYDEHYEDAELAHMWICNSDARNYAVIGDPAVRILRAGERAAAPPPTQATQTATERSEMPEARDTHDTQDSHDPVTGNYPVVRDDEPPRPRAIEPASYGWFGGKDDKEPGALVRLGNKVGEVLAEVFNDAAVLEVKTYTSDDLQAVAAGQPLPATGARLRAYTRCKLDGDTEVCVPVRTDGAIDEALWTLHVEMVKQAQAHRAELLKTVLSLFSSRLGK
ncbi:MAG TPA: hypothetical protein VHT91_41350 [Kofleriaceae bacterium]|jgi:hypothetical protein|nr:hypothetical protein [Kofleriaceae bacterium]